MTGAPARFQDEPLTPTPGLSPRGAASTLPSAASYLLRVAPGLQGRDGRHPFQCLRDKAPVIGTRVPSAGVFLEDNVEICTKGRQAGEDELISVSL